MELQFLSDELELAITDRAETHRRDKLRLQMEVQKQLHEQLEVKL
ncbi:F14J16.25 [Arabidopsis thaliana]|uniref:F14J16.25 n=1 Tax=Arabidopsis thaliana TaxID=3702 RepID=Q9LG13_ARATH|nr:F14J16.25 [Arabidopsis thaliana]